MKPNFIEEMRKEYEAAQADQSKQYMVVIMELPNTPMAEVIINPRPNFEAKATYYINVYNELGALKVNPNVKFVAFKFVDSLEEANEFIQDFS